MQCPTCKGKKELFAFQNTGEDYRQHRQGMVPCITCDGSGEVDDGFPARLAEGERMREERLQRGETLMEAAKRQGLTPAQLSALEHGRPIRSQ